MSIQANLVLDQGATFDAKFLIRDSANNIIDLTGYTGASKMRKSYASANSHTFIVSVEASNGIVQLSMSAANTSNVAYGRYVYDVELTSVANVISRVFEGVVTVKPEVTK